VIVYLIIK